MQTRHKDSVHWPVSTNPGYSICVVAGLRSASLTADCVMFAACRISAAG